jgi:hypothetical protein
MKPRSECECGHEFVLVLTDVPELTDSMLDALFEAGCDDSTPSVQSSRVYLRFTRMAPSLKDAILSAIRDVRTANIGADVLRVDYCNLVTQSEIAQKIGRSRQLVHQFIAGERGPGGFPPAACHVEASSPLYYWCEVADWLYRNNMVTSDVVQDAREVEMINSVLEMRHLRDQDRALYIDVSQAVYEMSDRDDIPFE